ncbi:hypothetical protein TURU_124597 [Turdus rufiventris]|nr:hypothetical protein TURU_124597 [Turdus rufiventris]
MQELIPDPPPNPQIIPNLQGMFCTPAVRLEQPDLLHHSRNPGPQVLEDMELLVPEILSTAQGATGDSMNSSPWELGDPSPVLPQEEQFGNGKLVAAPQLGWDLRKGLWNTGN